MTRRPLLSASLAFVAGVALGAWLPQAWRGWGWATAALLVAWAIAHLRRRSRLGTGLGVAVFILLGILRCQTQLALLFADVDGVPEGEAVFAGRVARPAERRGADLVLVLEDVRARFEADTYRLDEPLQLILEENPETFRIGDRITARGRLSAIRGERNLGWFPRPAVPRGRRFAARAVVRSPFWIGRDGREPGRGLSAAVLRWREAAAGFWQERPGAPAAIQNALTTGERAEIPSDVNQTFFRSGLTHLLAISGMNVGFLAVLVYLILRRLLASWEALALRFPVQPYAALLTVPFLWFFYRFSGSQIPAGRAVLMSALGMAAVFLYRRTDPIDLCGLAAAAIVAWDPCALFSASLQLSFVAVAGLALVAPRLAAPVEEGEGRGRRLIRAARSLLLVSLAAGAVTAPVVAYHFQQLSLVGPVANLVAVPYTGFIVLPAGWIALGAAAVWGPAGELLRGIALTLSAALVGIAAFFATPGWSFLRVLPPPPALTLALLALAASFLPPGTRTVRRLRAAAAAAVLLAAGWWWAAISREEMRIVFFDVGQGFSAAAFLPGGKTIVVDAGPAWRRDDAGKRLVAPALRRLGARQIDVLALTHAHPDHSGGAASLLAEFNVKEIWRGAPDDGGMADALADYRRRGGAVCTLARDEVRGYEGGIRVRFLNPASSAPAAAETSEAVNDRSLAFLVAWRKSGLLVTGDAGPGVAREMAEIAGARPETLILQVPHHGGSAAACRELAVGFQPAFAVIPVGRNSYGHPREDAVAALAATARVLRTDREGAVFFRTDGFRTKMRTWRELSRGRTWRERMRWLVAGW